MLLFNSQANDEMSLEQICYFSSSTIKQEHSAIKKIILPNHSIALHALAKDRQKKDNHNMSKFEILVNTGNNKYGIYFWFYNCHFIYEW